MRIFSRTWFADKGLLLLWAIVVDSPVFYFVSNFDQYKSEIIPLLLLYLTWSGLIFLLAWQMSKRQYFPIIRRNRCITGFPLLFVVATIILYFIPSIHNNIGNLLTIIFGIVTLASLVISIAVLVSVRETFQEELKLLEVATDIIQSAQNKLVFVVLTPNLGFARAIYKQEAQLIKNYHLALVGKLDEMIALAKSSKPVKVQIAMLSPADISGFLSKKAKDLENVCTLSSKEEYENGSECYQTLSTKLINKMNLKINEGTQAAKENFTVAVWKVGCLSTDGSGKLTTAFPPLSMIIADDHSALLFYNEPLLSAAPVGLQGRILKSSQEINSFSMLVDSYIEKYKQ